MPCRTQKPPKRIFAPLLLVSLLSACAKPPPTTALPLFGQGYRFDGDICRNLGEDAYTNPFLDDAADLVACPSDAENLGVFVAETGALEVARREGYTLYSVPIR